MCALSLDIQGCGKCAKDKSNQDSKNDSSDGSIPNTTLAGGDGRTVATEAAQNSLSMIRAFAKEQKAPTLVGTQMRRWQDAIATAKEARVRSSVHQLLNPGKKFS